jgi:L-proline amide hydrolase
VATEGYAQFEEWATWYRVDGDLAGERPPLVALHGGPGATHEYLLPLIDLAHGGRAVVLYDQLGNGNSTHLPERMGDGDFWTPALFVRELANLVEHLGLERYHVLGQSWGGFLAQEYALTQPAGLRSLILANTAASFPDFLAECNRLRLELPADVQETLQRHEAEGTTDDSEYMESAMVFYMRHVCRLGGGWPDEVQQAFASIEADPTVYHTMNGPSEFHVIGSIKDWQVKDRLNEIRVPTLVASGRYDEATPALQETLMAGIAGAEQVIFEGSSHMPFWEERERFMAVVGDFLARHD